MRRIDELHLELPFYGSRRMTFELNKEGRGVNRKRVRRLMRVMGIEALVPRPGTSKAAPGHKIYPYLLRGLKIVEPNHVWAADVTYIPMACGFLYRVAIIDWASRAGSGVAAVEHQRCELLRGGAGGGAASVRKARPRPAYGSASGVRRQPLAVSAEERGGRRGAARGRTAAPARLSGIGARDPQAARTLLGEMRATIAEKRDEAALWEIWAKAVFNLADDLRARDPQAAWALLDEMRATIADKRNEAALWEIWAKAAAYLFVDLHARDPQVARTLLGEMRATAASWDIWFEEVANLLVDLRARDPQAARALLDDLPMS